MPTTRALFLAASLASLAGGCGPMSQPMAARLDVEAQKEVDAAWDRALEPVGRLDRGRWLDLFVGAQVYQVGVDRLSFRSEKRFRGGLVIMEVSYDRAAPDGDRFEVRVLDREGRVARRESYGRAEVEKAYRDLFDTLPAEPREGEGLEVARRRAEQKARWDAIAEYVPSAGEKKRRQ